MFLLLTVHAGCINLREHLTCTQIPITPISYREAFHLSQVDMALCLTSSLTDFSNQLYPLCFPLVSPPPVTSKSSLLSHHRTPSQPPARGTPGCQDSGGLGAPRGPAPRPEKGFGSKASGRRRGRSGDLPSANTWPGPAPSHPATR